MVGVCERPVVSKDDDREVAARQLDVLLDLVAYHAADVSAFLLDPTYASMLDEGEAILAKNLTITLALAQRVNSPVADAVRRRLDNLGSED